MTSDHLGRKSKKIRVKLRRNTSLPIHTATLILISVFIITGLIVGAWFAGEGNINAIFNQLNSLVNSLERRPPMWLEVPMVAGRYLLAPSVGLFVLVLLLMKISPQPRPWSRRLVVGILLILTIRYLMWRLFLTLNLATPLNGVCSLGLFFFEILVLTSTIIQLFLMSTIKDRHREADEKSLAVINKTFHPKVDVFIPTYNEPDFILRRTIIGCQALDYENKKIYLLDDTRRPEIEKLANSLQCEYITRPDNLHAKAGNLNHAMPLTNGELIVIFDADFIPTKNFLTRTVGFFQDEQVALVQTPQSFYNPDPIAYNLGLENVVTPEEEIFYRQIQPIKDGVGSAICSGTSFIVRRSSLEYTGGFVTESLSEDYFTGIRLVAEGYKLVYLDEKLSAGLAAENIAAYATQRIRWAQGTLQAFFIKTNPLTIRGLRPIQRLAHLEGLLNWFTNFSRMVFLIMPLLYSFLNVIPIRATLPEILYYFVPYFLVQLTVFSWLNYRSRSAVLSEIYGLVLTFPLVLTIIQVMLNPFSRGFKVTPKGNQSKHYTFNWSLALPIIILFIATAISLWRNLGMCLTKLWMETHGEVYVEHFKGLGLGWLWSAYNLILLTIALLILFDAPKPNTYEWFDLRRIAKLNITSSSPLWGITTMISEIGAEVALTQKSVIELEKGMSVSLEIEEENLVINAVVLSRGFKDEFPTVRLQFEHVTLTQHRSLVEMLFCRPGQWRRQNTPGEFRSLLLLFKVLLMPRILFDRKIDVNPMVLAKF
jgi:cellulose synthase (UDP-forming)